jgi:putative ABC transport system substrate-binding protein
MNKTLMARIIPVTVLLFLLGVLLFPTPARAEQAWKIGVLMANDTRLDTFEGFKTAMAEHAAGSGATHAYTVKNAKGDRSVLAGLAAEIIAAKPDLAVAAGGIEADALKVASAGTGIPVIFLAVSSAQERGLVASMQNPGGNITGIDTNDTVLVEKRLWYISKLLPKARTVLCFNIPTIAPSAASIALARKIAPQLGLQLKVIDVASKEEVAPAAAALHSGDADVILLLPVAPIDATIKETLLPLSRRAQIPIMGYNEESIDLGAFAAYGSSRNACGAQAAQMAIKVLHGIPPGDLPVETPSTLTLTINRKMTEELGLKLSKRSWNLASTVVNLNP